MYEENNSDFAAVSLNHNSFTHCLGIVMIVFFQEWLLEKQRQGQEKRQRQKAIEQFNTDIQKQRQVSPRLAL